MSQHFQCKGRSHCEVHFPKVAHPHGHCSRRGSISKYKRFKLNNVFPDSNFINLTHSVLMINFYNQNSDKLLEELHAGCFGKTTVEKRYLTPSRKNDRGSQFILTESQWRLRTLPDLDRMQIELPFEFDDERKVVVVRDMRDNDDYLDLNPRCEIEREPTLFESLCLSSIEACYLQLVHRVIPQGILFWCCKNNDFVYSFVAYNYFRSKNYYVKDGFKFGGNFLLYKDHPTTSHANYVIVIEVYKNKTKITELNWNKICNISRVAQSTNKKVLVCSITVSDQFDTLLTEDKLESPEYFSSNSEMDCSDSQRESNKNKKLKKNFLCDRNHSGECKELKLDYIKDFKIRTVDLSVL